MADDITPDQVAAIAAAARVPLDAAAAARVARTVSTISARFAALNLTVPFEVEPATFVAVQRRGATR